MREADETHLTWTKLDSDNLDLVSILKANITMSTDNVQLILCYIYTYFIVSSVIAYSSKLLVAMQISFLYKWTWHAQWLLQLKQY